MKALRAIIMAFSMYSRLPMPRVEWTEESRSWALCAFPLVGAAVGAALFLWSLLSSWLEIDAVLRGVVFMVLPLAITGGIHMDGFCDTCDALFSHQDRETKLAIMSDPHVGTFAVLGCVIYLILTSALWCQLEVTEFSQRMVIMLCPIFSRILSAYAAVSQPNARGNGLLAAFTEGDVRPRRRLLSWMGVVAAALLIISGLGGTCVLAALLVYLWYLRMARREFGGLTGDLAGCFLQLCELAELAVLVLSQQVLEVLL